MIKKALISVFYKDGLEAVAKRLHQLGVEIVSTGGTYDFIASLGIPVAKVEDLTQYPSIFGGRVKTLHPAVFGGILNRRENKQDSQEKLKYNISDIDLVIVDLYPFEEYLKKEATHEEIIEKIDIGGISLIRAAAKNYKDVVIIPSKDFYPYLLDILNSQGADTTLEQREYLAAQAFLTSSHYDTAIFGYFNRKFDIPAFAVNETDRRPLRYGENPHQKGAFFGDTATLPKQLHGKEISYNNMLDIEAALELISDFNSTTVAVIKHNNACCCATAATVKEAWEKALAADPVSAFGGIIISNREITEDAAAEINKIFFEVIIAPSYSNEALEILKCKKNRIILVSAGVRCSGKKFRSMLGGILVQERDTVVETQDNLKVVTQTKPSAEETDTLLFANKIVKHSKSNAIVLAKGSQMLSSGIGQTSRVDALKQAVEKAKAFGFSLKGASLASDAFFPFKDCVEIAAKEGITAIIQPGGSIRDEESIESCNQHGIAMVTTGIRHFKH